MLPKFHILVGFLFSLGVYFILPNVTVIECGIIFFSSFLIDFDHYLYYLLKKKSFNLKKAYYWFKKKGESFSKIPKEERKNYALIISFFHGLEWVFIFYMLGRWVNVYFYFIAIGITLHLILDWVSSFRQIGRVFKVSIIFDYLYNKTLKET